MLFPDILELLEFLEKGQQPDQYLFRGQLKRFPPHKWKTGGKTYEIEAIYPRDFRFYYEHHAPSEELVRKTSSARAFGREVRDQFVLFLHFHLTKSRGDHSWASSIISDLLVSGQTISPQGTPF